MYTRLCLGRNRDLAPAYLGVWVHQLNRCLGPLLTGAKLNIDICAAEGIFARGKVGIDKISHTVRANSIAFNVAFLDHEGRLVSDKTVSIG